MLRFVRLCMRDTMLCVFLFVSMQAIFVRMLSVSYKEKEISNLFY